MPYDQPADTISSGSLSAENAAEMLKPIRKDVAGEPKDVDTSEGDEPQGDEPESESEDTSSDEDESPDEVEGDSEQADDEESSDEESEEADESDAEEPEGRYAVKVDGKEVKVTLEELKKGYSFTAHNTRRAQELSQKERDVLAKEAEAAETAKTYAEHLKQVKEALVALTPKEPDWDKLQKENPAKFAEQWAAWSKHKEGLKKLDEEQQAALAKVKAEEEKAHVMHLLSENEKLVAAVPAWKDNAVRAKEVSAMAEFAKSLGFTQEEIDSVVDHRTVLLLRYAYKHGVSQKNANAVKERVNEVKTLTPGSSASQPGRLSVAQKAMKRLEETGSVDDAVAALQAQRAVGGRPRRR